MMSRKLKTKDQILIKVRSSEKISMSDLAMDLELKRDAISQSVGRIRKNGLLNTERVRIKGSFVTFVYMNKLQKIEHDKRYCQVDTSFISSGSSKVQTMLDNKDFKEPTKNICQVELDKNNRILENSNIELDIINKQENPFNFIDPKADQQNMKGRVKLPLDKLRSFYYDLTFNPRTLKGKSHRKKRGDLIDRLIEQLEGQREA